ncbi:MAG: hypothetical protein ABIH52_01160 [Candidatus Aenigmatarchaeota archaeon]
MKFSTLIWDVEPFDEPIPASSLHFETTGGTTYPDGAEECEIRFWNDSVDTKQDVLDGEGKETQIRDGEGGRKELWAKNPGDAEFRMSMVPGVQYRYINMSGDTIYIERVLFSQSLALQSEEYRSLFTKAGIELPLGTLAPVLYIITPEGIVATVRGSGTPKYPGGIWGVGGDVDNPSITLAQHLKNKELKEELVVPAGINDMITLGLVFDKALMKHDIVVVAKTESHFSEIKKGDGYLPDVESVMYISLDGLSSFLIHNFVPIPDATNKCWIGKPTPACSGGLFLVGSHINGPVWQDRVHLELQDIR